MSEKIIDRVRKMLALANDLGATEGEREAALHHAYKTLAHHNLTMTDLEVKAEKRDSFTTDNFSFPFARKIARIMGDLFFCYTINGHKINGTQQHYIFVGTESNAATAMVMTDFIIKSVMKEGRKLYKQNTSPECRSFCLGAAARLRARVDQMIAEAKSVDQPGEPGSALVLASMYDTEATCNTSLAEVLFDITHSKGRSSNVKSDAYSAGKQFGDKINLSLQVGGASKPAPLRIK